MRVCRASGNTATPRLVLGFGNVGARAITEGIAAIGTLLTAS
jgi:GntR family transcriptional regulator/MocR family aminotransferase